MEGKATGAVVVGIDGSEASTTALDWAAQQAQLESRPLLIVHAVGGRATKAKPSADQLAEAAGKRVRDTFTDMDIRTVTTDADPRQALLDMSAHASALVVGDRGRGPIRELLLGSVSQAVAKHSESPVVVVRTGKPQGRPHAIVVGVAGDERDGPVLDFAFRLASARGWPVTLLHCYWDVLQLPEGVREIAADEPGFEDERKVLIEAASEVAEKFPDVPITHLLALGFADQQLIVVSRSAELLVLGHSRKPFLNEMVYGSVSPRVIEHAACSVAVVPVDQNWD